jgi:hypothetical protein
VGFFDNAVDKRITKFVLEFTGQYVVPIFHTPCDSSISMDWNGWCAMDDKSIWLVNKWGARGALFESLVPTDNWGQYPHDTRGFPLYRFGFQFQDMNQGFTVYPKTATGGAELNQRLNRVFGSM